MTADDFGLSDGINAGIISAYRKGIVSSASICAGGKAFDGAAEFARCNPGLSLGAHIVLTGNELPCAGAERIRGLCARNGRLFPSVAVFAMRFYAGKITKRAVGEEIDAQLLKLREHGLVISHLDSHQFVHLLPGIMEIMLRKCVEYRIPYVRFPYYTFTWHDLACGRFLRLASQLVLNTLCACWKARIRKAGIKTCDRFIGFLLSGRMTEDGLMRVIRRLSDGVSELNCHPAWVNAELVASYGAWGYDWETELGALCSDDIRTVLRTSGVKLSGFSRHMPECGG